MLDQPPLPISELVLECIDALDAPMHDNQCREGHLASIAHALATDSVSDELRSALADAASLFAHHQRQPIADLMFDPRASEAALIARLRAFVPRSEQFIYHGTVQKRLLGITESGFVGGANAVWKGLVDDDHLNAGVFFATSWRSALNWASIAHLRTRGRKEGEARLPAVLRIRKGNLEIEPDKRAQAGGSLMVRGVVSSDGAEFFLGEPEGIPRWTPLKIP